MTVFRSSESSGGFCMKPSGDSETMSLRLTVGAVSRAAQHLYIRFYFPQPRDGFLAPHTRHDQVDDNEVYLVAPRAEELDSRLAVLGVKNRKTVAKQETAPHFPDTGIIVDDEDLASTLSVLIGGIGRLIRQGREVEPEGRPLAGLAVYGYLAPVSFHDPVYR